MVRRRQLVLSFTLVTATLLLALVLRDPASSLPPALLANRQRGSKTAPDDEPDYFAWNTSSRFSRPHANRPPLSENGCDLFPQFLLSHVQVVLKVGSSEPPERLDTQLETVCRCISNLLIFSDRDGEHNGRRIHDILVDLPPSLRTNNPDINAYDALHTGDGKLEGGEPGWRLDRFKFLPMVERAAMMNPSAKWFIFIEADTYIFWDNLFRLLDSLDSETPQYLGSPSPGRHVPNGNGEKTWFAFGGTGVVLSRAAINKVTARDVGSYGEFVQPPLSTQYERELRVDPCGDSVLGWALYNVGINLSGLYPMFQPHPLHGIPFGDALWCQPVISLHKSHLKDMVGLAKFEDQRDRSEPLLYADLIEYTQLGAIDRKSNWENADWGGFTEPESSDAHASAAGCRQNCYDREDCFGYTYSGRCHMVRTMRLGYEKKGEGGLPEAGWNVEKIREWKMHNKCERPLWMKPSTKRIF